MLKRNLRLERVYPYPPERLWRALTDSAAMNDWLMPNDFQPVVGHKFQFHTMAAPTFDGTVYCEVLEIDAPRRLAPISLFVAQRSDATANHRYLDT
jgi:uncharacterized protein YndB with AHSA1/START domain